MVDGNVYSLSMNYLFSYLKALDETEAERLTRCDLSPREEATLATLLDMLRDHDPTKEEACSRLEMSSSMFDKTCSLLLRKVYKAIVPEGGLSLLTDLHSKALLSNFVREVGREERAIKEKGRNEKREFYRDLFNLIHSRFNINYNPDLAKRVAREWKKLDRSKATAYYTEVCILGMETWKVAAGEANEEANEGLRKHLEKLERVIRPDLYPLARFRLNKVLSIYLAQIHFDIPHRAAVLKEALQLCADYPEEIPESERVATELILAEHEYFFGEDHRTAHTMYREIFQRTPEELTRQPYHRMKYIQLSLILGDYAAVESILKEQGAVTADIPDVGKAKGAALMWAKLFLYKKKFDEARRYIDLAFELNQKRFYVQYEIECRLLQTAWFALRGDDPGVEALAPAHMKYLRSKGYYLKTSDFYPWFFKLALAFIDERTTGKPLSGTLEKKYEEFQKGAAAQYGLLLKQMRGAYRP